jgi:NADPH:quinone reductase-like Zn-dependent oxidoreductase
VASAANADLVRSLGADHFVDYRSQRFQDVLRDYDVVFDTIGKESLGTCVAVLRRRGIYVTTVPNLKNALAAFGTRLRTSLLGRRSSIVLVRSRGRDLELLGRWAEEGILRSVVDQVAPLAEAAKIHDYSRTFRTRGKNVLRVREESEESP